MITSLNGIYIQKRKENSKRTKTKPKQNMLTLKN